MTKKSARAYGSTTAWKASSASCMLSDGSPPPGDGPAAPTKLPIAAMSGLKIFEPPAAGAAGLGPARGRRGRGRCARLASRAWSRASSAAIRLA